MLPDVKIELRRDVGRLGPLTTGPWIRKRQIARMFGGAPDPRALGCIVDRNKEPIAWGLVSEHSAITVRVLSFSPQRPTEDWLEQRIQAAVDARTHLGLREQGTDGYREINSEGDGLPGLIVDRYGDDRVVQLTTAPMVARETAVLSALQVTAPTQGTVYVLRSEATADLEGFASGHAVHGVAGPLRFREDDLPFVAPEPPTQKTGAYLDQRDNRREIAALCRAMHAPVLDVGCHIGGFALHAARAGQRAVGLDQSPHALEWAERNAAAQDAQDRVQWVKADMFAPWTDPALEGPFGVVVIDPPKIARRKGDVERASRAFAQVARQAEERLQPGGVLVLCSCSHHLGWPQLDGISQQLRGATTRLRRLGPGLDHPVAPGHREGEYLRVGLYQRR